MKLVMMFLVLLFSLSTFAGVEVTTDAGGRIGIFNKINCDSSLTCTKTGLGKVDIAASGTFTTSILGDGTGEISGFLSNQVSLATSAAVTIDECGSTIVNSATAVATLPEASTAIGCRLTFITGNASNFDVNPDDADQILVETNAAGDAMRNATLGNSITIEAISATEWAPVSVIGTWSDVN